MLTKLFAVFGNPIAHSRSPQIHQLFAQNFNINIEYQRRLLEIDNFEDGMQKFITEGGVGANITLPFKELAYQFATKHSALISHDAQLSEAVNTFCFKDDSLIADNTDGRGFIYDLKNNLQWNIAGKRVLLIGAGGSAKGIIAQILTENPAYLQVANRSLDRTTNLIAHLKNNLATSHQLYDNNNLSAISLENLTKQKLEPFDLVINASSSSLQKQEINFSKDLIHQNSQAYDLMYIAGGKTIFLQQLENLGVKNLADGWGMLVEQAAEGFELWHGVRPETKQVLGSLRP